jgi:sulfide:quinone oxidoreductase
MRLPKLTDDLAVTGQLDPSDVASVAEEGIRAIICNRPDGEASDQPLHREIEREAAARGIAFVYQPVVSGAIADADAIAFEGALRELPKPVLAYCRSGTRCAALWSLSEAGKRSVDDILARTRQAGYDMTALLPRLEKAKRPL